MEPIESRIGYHFSNQLLLAEALTHPSLAYESKKPHFDNQRLEFLGDAVIQLILTDKLFNDFPGDGEGRLTKLRSQLVSRPALCHYAHKIELGHYLLLGKGESSSGGRERPSNLADAFEALIGAIYLDGGIDAARNFLFSNFGNLIEKIIVKPEESNPKGELQETLQAISAVSPTYTVISQQGPDHDKIFISEVTWEEITLGTGKGSSKKESETAAATEALKSKRWLRMK
ncbi:MAG: ribonuclease III [Verrucomicrobiales bacterium]|nr:ribonuclease III [Verrucomicrobiales bacterium]